MTFFVFCYAMVLSIEHAETERKPAEGLALISYPAYLKLLANKQSKDTGGLSQTSGEYANAVKKRADAPVNALFDALGGALAPKPPQGAYITFAGDMAGIQAALSENLGLSGIKLNAVA